MRRALLYINSTGQEYADRKIQQTLEQFCEVNGIEMYAVFCDDTNHAGIAEPTIFMAIGMAADKQIDTVVTMCAGMLGDSHESILDTVAWFKLHGITALTAANDIREYYDILESDDTDETDDTCDCDSGCDEKRFYDLVMDLYKR
ncbi:MAG: hypothetical protein IJZ96_11445 [Lachnospiraceae bacterium]|nr:hypothetical protein [Lachnospiraceae bacterium]